MESTLLMMSTPAKENHEIEYICDPKNEQFGFYPRRHKKLDQLNDKANANYWPATEVQFKSDFNDFKQMTPDEQRVIMKVQMFFSQADGIIQKTLSVNFLNIITIRESIDFMATQNHVEMIHNQTYGNIIKILFADDDVLQNKILHALENYPEIKKISSWYDKWMSDDNTLAEKLFAQILSEGLFFQGAFVIIFWIRQYKPGKLPGVTKANKLISIDEELHASHFTELYNMLKKKLTNDEAHAIIGDAVSYTIDFTNNALESPIIGINANDMAQYIRYVADSWLDRTGHPKKYNAKNPFGWLIMMACEEKTNFHECKPTAYNDSHDNSAGIITDDF